MSQSVNLNFNSSMFSQKASNYECYFDKDLTIPPNSKVALYQGELTKAPLTLTKDNDMSIFINSSTDENKAYVLHNTNSALVNNNDLDEIKFTIPKGNYSKREFLNTVQSKGQTAINNRNTSTSKNRVPYQLIQQNNNKDLFLGLAPDFNYSTRIVDIAGEAVDKRQNNVSITSNLTTTVDIRPSVIADTADFGSHFMCQSAINPLSMVKDFSSSEHMYQAQNTMFFSVIDKSSDDTNKKFGVAFASTSSIKRHINGDKLGTFTNDDGEEAVKAPINLEFNNNNNEGVCYLSIYINSLLGSMNSGDVISNDNMTKLSELKIGSLDLNDRFGFQIYLENGVNPNSILYNKYYFRVFGVNINTPTDDNNFNDYLEGNNNILYDSKQDNISISINLISQCFKYEIGGDQFLEEQYYSGLVPTFYFSDLTGTDKNIYGYSNIKANFIYDNTQSPSITNRDVVGLLRYSFSPLGDELKEIFGKDEIININPNGWDRFQNNNFGVDEIFGNRTNYNIQIQNLPIKSFNSTTDKNIGNEQPIIFTLNNGFSGNLTEINSGNIIRTIYPPQLKYLALNNDRPLKLNNLHIKITRASTNQEAEELEDAKIEILIN